MPCKVGYKGVMRDDSLFLLHEGYHMVYRAHSPAAAVLSELDVHSGFEAPESAEDLLSDLLQLRSFHREKCEF